MRRQVGATGAQRAVGRCLDLSDPCASLVDAVKIRLQGDSKLAGICNPDADNAQ